MMYNRTDLKGKGYGPFAVYVLENYIHTLKDGTKIAIKMWLPGNPKEMFSDAEDKWVKPYCLPLEGKINNKVNCRLCHYLANAFERIL